MAELREYHCVVRNAEEVGGTLLVELHSEDGSAFDYIAGQYLYLEIAPDDFRPFSIASRPADDHLELHIRLMPDNPTLNAVQKLMQAGNTLRVRLADGHCTLARKQGNRPLLFIAGGTGYAPFHAMLEDLVYQNLSEEIHVYWGAATYEELYLHQEIQDWSINKPNLFYQPVVQFPKPGEEVFEGMVHEAALAEITNLADYDIYVGGSALMVGSVYKALVAQGAQPDHIYSDMLDLGLCNLDDD